ncbi:oxidoreductase-like domain-containing protein [uncultured Amphritea sp.]|uniref:oxidoreductase-like domain-containing protein n=1 Tax=uncultured Amphritea sp. TaxID=981605 RepID=UPI00261C17BF|nr:oxidoreductase-like domain-containing protein [uncultured Amphritea sp.]
MSQESTAQPVTVVIREKPTPPADYECCESACSPCVWDTYYEELNIWNAEQKALKEAVKMATETEQSE